MEGEKKTETKNERNAEESWAVTQQRQTPPLPLCVPIKNTQEAGCWLRKRDTMVNWGPAVSRNACYVRQLQELIFANLVMHCCSVFCEGPESTAPKSKLGNVNKTKKIPSGSPTFHDLPRLLHYRTSLLFAQSSMAMLHRSLYFWRAVFTLAKGGTVPEVH